MLVGWCFRLVGCVRLLVVMCVRECVCGGDWRLVHVLVASLPMAGLCRVFNNVTNFNKISDSSGVDGCDSFDSTESSTNCAVALALGRTTGCCV